MKTGFFEESLGVKSSTRLFSFLLLVFFMVFNLLWLSTTNNGIDGNYLLFNILMLIGIFVPKYLHKLAEKVIDKHE